MSGESTAVQGGLIWIENSDDLTKAYFWDDSGVKCTLTPLFINTNEPKEGITGFWISNESGTCDYIAEDNWNYAHANYDSINSLSSINGPYGELYLSKR